MQLTIIELNKIIADYEGKINGISESEFAAKPLSNKWSKKEVLGHLIDSAQNNLRRFVCGQYEPIPQKIVYNQDHWVNSNDYQQTPGKEVIALWVLLNKRIASILQKMPTAAYTRESDTGSNTVSLHSLEWLAKDYVRHLKHHLNQIIPGSFDVRYPS
jgi:hypothetical protein